MIYVSMLLHSRLTVASENFFLRGQSQSSGGVDGLGRPARNPKAFR
jgi:hypothetical protein